MEQTAIWRITTFMAAILSTMASTAQNPIIQTAFTPDPAPYVHGDTVYLFTDHDEDTASYFAMKDWMLYSTVDMVNWTYRGTPMSTATFRWAYQGDNAWASQAVERNGKWYWYVAAEDLSKGLHGIGVAVADSPDGPWTDALGEPLVPGNWGYIDPTVFIDDDGQAYLYWGNNGLYYALLNEDMISLKGSVHTVDIMDTDAFGPLCGEGKDESNYEEGPWLYKRDGRYYLEYAAGGVPEYMAYSWSDSPTGPWRYGGKVMNVADNSFTIHGGSITFKNRHFMFYHNGGLKPDGGGFRRSSCVEEFTPGDDGSIPFIPFTSYGVATPVTNMSPYDRVEAETMADSYGLKTSQEGGAPGSGGSPSRVYITSIHDGDWLRVRALNFGRRLKDCSRTFTACVSAANSGALMEIRLDAADGELLGKLNITSTGGDDIYQLQTADISMVTGIHDIYLLFKGDSGNALFNFDYWTLGSKKVEAADAQVTALAAEEDTVTIQWLNESRLRNIVAYTRSGQKAYIDACCAFVSANPDIATIDSLANISAPREGTTDISASYTNDDGTAYTVNFIAEVTAFPLTSEAFNPSLDGTGTFDESTGVFSATEKTTGGWTFNGGVDLTSYLYIIVQLQTKPSVGTTFILNDGSDDYTRTITGKTTRVKISNATKIDRAAITEVALRLSGEGEITLARVFLSQDGETPAGIALTARGPENRRTARYNLAGQRVGASYRGIVISDGKKIGLL